MRTTLLTAFLLTALCTAACGEKFETQEDLALRGCLSALSEKLGAGSLDDEERAPVQRVMIGAREYGWLVRGLADDVAGAGQRNFQCRMAGTAGEDPDVASIDLCPPTGEPWGCPSPPR